MVLSYDIPYSMTEPKTSSIRLLVPVYVYQLKHSFSGAIFCNIFCSFEDVHLPYSQKRHEDNCIPAPQLAG